ncbi:ankyrin repeat and SAM domain-containing protein 3 [Bufo bufo]|uniref:ankyrin repeat and SAM domain-containing protein 3 n=1 Tax=Bufo bufo TaxID=8384 RepID=UPI001ABDA961|nr:ankyrin repeat and SAM domain-containing protein 3 [Bufo bufo]XP_040297729.1 ankyrin repeat and SAM domain-containing protein 3 [Bufo bufo]XP_040297730.1 ankyrin repeat and SAM domain-containing protein 3 [Bufo bufo]
MAELSDDASETEMLSCSLSMWYGEPSGGQELSLDLHTAASIGQCEVVQSCVRRRDVDLNQPNLGGWTPLMYASYIGHDAVVSLLLEAGVDVNCRTPSGQTPLMLAASCGNESAAYFLIKQGAEIEARDARGWTALFHCTSAGHQRTLRFLLENGANAEAKEPVYGFTPLMEAAASGHEIIVQHLLNHGVKLTETDHNGDTARMLAARYGHSRIVSLFDSHRAKGVRTHSRGSARHEDLSSSDESSSAPHRPRHQRKPKGPSIHDGPQALAKITGGGPSYGGQLPPQGYVTFNDVDYETGGSEDLRYRDVTSPINEHDVESNGSSKVEGYTGRQRSSSSEGICINTGMSSEASLESNEDSDPALETANRKHTKSFGKGRQRNGDAHTGPGPSHCRTSNTLAEPNIPRYNGPKDLAELLEQIGCSKYLSVFQEQDVNLRIFLTLTEIDLREVGITLFGPKRKMTSAIARWHSSARPPGDALEQAYADRLEAEMQELAIQLHKKCEETDTLKGQVDQERELRAVAEGCLMEQETKWRAIHGQLEATSNLAADAQRALAQLRSCQEELSLRLGKVNAARTPACRPAAPKGSNAAPLKSLSVQELSTSQEESSVVLEKAVRALQDNLEKMRTSDKGRHKWPDP